MLSTWLEALTHRNGPTLNTIGQPLRGQLEKVISLPETRALSAERSQRSISDQKYLERLTREAPDKLSEALSILGYTNTLKHWQSPRATDWTTSWSASVVTSYEPFSTG